MKKLYNFYLLVFIFVLCISNGYSQIQTKNYPKGYTSQKFQTNLKLKKYFILPHFDVAVYLEEDRKNSDKTIPYRFGKGFNVNMKIKKENWEKVENGYIFSIEFYSKGAKSINFIFRNLNLSENAELFIMNEDKTIVYGPVNKESNTEGRFLTDIIPGEKVTLYIFDSSENAGASNLEIYRVIHGYRGFQDAYGNPGGSLSCNNDIICHSDWDLQSDGVGLVLLSNGDELCSGSLLMSADQSFRPYFLTAFHCIDLDGNGGVSGPEEAVAEDWLFKFQFKATSCNGSYYTSGYTYNGSTLRSSWVNTDFALMELDNSPVGNSEISWAGWNRNANPATSGTGIHHPVGDVMKISFDYDNLQSNTNQIIWIGGPNSNPNTHWIVDFDNGTAQGGSSGSPLFDQNKKVIGQLHGGESGCAPVTKYYGQFHNSWTGGGTNTTRLSNWLDPCGSGVTTTNTLRNPVITGSDVICTSTGNYSVNGLPTGSSITWSNSSNISRNSSQGSNPCIFSASGSLSGNGWIKATITNSCGNTYSIQKNVWVGTYLPLDVRLRDPSTNNPVYVVCYYQTVTVKAAHDFGFVPDDWQWSVSGASVNYPYSNDNSLATLHPYSYNITVKIKAHNDCGWSEWANVSPGVMPCGGMYFTVSPNPAQSEITISPTEAQTEGVNILNVDNRLNQITVDVELYDINGIKVKQMAFNIGEPMTIGVSHLRNGIYFLKIFVGNYTETHPLVVN